MQLGALNSGWEYGLIGFCDSGCGTFDLVLYDGNNRQIARGIGKPELEVKPRQTQNYWARVSMSGCNVNPCNWGFIVAKKQLASMATPVPPSVTPARPAHAQTHNVASRRALVASTGNQTDVTAFQLNNDTNYQIAIHWIDYAGNPNPNRVISPPGNHWRISGGVKTWESHWYAIYNPSGFLCSFSPRQNTTVNLSQLAACK